MTASNDSVSSGGRMELLVEVAQHQFRCRVGAGSDVGPRPSVTPVPRTPGWLAGLTVGRERVIPVVDLSRVLGLEYDQAPRARMLTVNEPGLRVGFLVDDVRSASDEDAPHLDLSNVAGALSQRLRDSLEHTR